MMNSLHGRTVLVIEDEWMLARDLSRAFETSGAHVVGPVPDVNQALEIVARAGSLDAAVVDLTLRGQDAYPVADALEERGVPFIFATGHEWDSIPARFHHVPMCIKPYETHDVTDILTQHLAAGEIRSSAGNKLLAALSPADYCVLSRYLEEVDLPRRMTLEYPGRVIDHCYFPSSGVVSIVAHSKPENVEVALIGREGVTGMSILAGLDRGHHEATVLVEGKGLRITARDLQEVIANRPGIAKQIRQFELSLRQQFSETALAASRFSLEQRLARWLLLLSDRSDTDHLVVTHELIAWKLGVRRAGITQGLRSLADSNLIQLDRGVVILGNREELVRLARSAYSGSATDGEAKAARL